MPNNPNFVPDSDVTLYALFGGTFDPVHYGHLRPVAALAQQAGLQKVIFLPNRVPPHRPQPEASPQQRLKMLELATAGNSLFTVDSRELQRTSTSYSIETLEIFRKELGESQPLSFIIGQDSLLSLHRWYRWQSILSLCHLVVCARPGYAMTLERPELQRWLHNHRVFSAERLRQRPCGHIWFADTVLLDISATDIRKRYHQGGSCCQLIPESVRRYIELQGLYQASQGE